MIDNLLIDNVMFLDIETVPEQSIYENLSERRQMLWDKKSLQWRKSQTPSEAYERAGIYAEFGKIICISVGVVKKNILSVKSFWGDNEVQVLKQFKASLNKFHKNRKALLCAHNGKEFDFPYLCRRMLINNINLPKLLQIQNKKPWEIALLDTLDLWRFGDYKNYTSLDLLCEIFNIPTPKQNDIDGSKVYKAYWEDNDLDRIVMYCEKDVVALASLFLKMIASANKIEDVVYVDRT